MLYLWGKICKEYRRFVRKLKDNYKYYLLRKFHWDLLTEFYKNYSYFDYYQYRASNDGFSDMTESNLITHWLYTDRSFKFKPNYKPRTKSVIIYTHRPFDLRDGGTTVQYYLAKLLHQKGLQVRIYPHRKDDITCFNPIYNHYYANDFDLEQTVVIYCEGIVGNPLNAPYVVRWMLSELGQNVPTSHAKTWGKNELVYYFNSERHFIPSNKHIYKLLTTLYINPEFKNHGKKRAGYCYTKRKSFMHKGGTTVLHPLDAFEITREHTQDDYINIFNQFEYFVCYDPLTFLINIAGLCGCIAIVHPVAGMTKKEWLQRIGYRDKSNMFGVAYGNSEEEIKYARSTLELVKSYFDLENKIMDDMVTSFIREISSWDGQNTLKNTHFQVKLSE